MKIKNAGIIKSLLVIPFALQLTCCSSADNSSVADSTVDLTGLTCDNIVVQGKTISVFDTDEEITAALGEAYADSINGVSNKVEKKTIIYKRDEGNAHNLDYVSFSNCYQKYQGEEFVCFNGINGKSTKDEVAKILGDNCIKIAAGENVDYYCYYVDGKEIDYSKVDVADGFVDTMGTNPYARAYCEDQLIDGDAQNYIEWKFFSNGEYFDCIATLYTKAK